MPPKKEKKFIPKAPMGDRAELHNLRMIKMVAPQCDPCQAEFRGDPDKGGFPTKRWWNDCPHDPYFTVVPAKTEIVPVYKTDEDGRKLKVGEEEVVVADEYKRLNLRQVAQSLRINAGRGPEKKRNGFGFKYVQELGYEPVCEYRNCESPSILTSAYGNYCSKLHARLIGLDVEAETVVLHGGEFGGGSKSQKAFDRQLRNINLSDND